MPNTKDALTRTADGYVGLLRSLFNLTRDQADAQAAALTPELFDELHQAVCQRKVIDRQLDATPLTVYINEGRWLVDCPCGSGVIVTPEWGSTAWCFGEACGRVLTAIAMPDDPNRIEQIMLDRPDPRTRNMQPDESISDLILENAAIGIGPIVAPAGAGKVI